MPKDRPPRTRSHWTRLPAPSRATATLAGLADVRLTIEQADASLMAAADRLALPRSSWGREDFNILALSGGAAGGAFGAGVLVGLTLCGARPNFAMVTGVSTGALMAPFAFLGPAWDERLTEAYTGGLAARLLSLGRLAPAFGAGLFRAEALESLIDPFVDAHMLSAVAAEHARGRRLLVATTNLDSQAVSIWDMGAIATHGGDQAVRLFRDVLAASASLPGLFPPRRFSCEIDGIPYEEMHVDGGVAAPLFIMPEPLLRWKNLRRRLRGGRVHVIVNTVLEPAPQTTALNLPAILMRSFDTMLRFSYRQALGRAASYCAAHNLPLSVASIPHASHAGSMLSFDNASMRGMFDAGCEHGQSPGLWATPIPEPSGWGGLLDRLKPVRATRARARNGVDEA